MNPHSPSTHGRKRRRSATLAAAAALLSTAVFASAAGAALPGPGTGSVSKLRVAGNQLQRVTTTYCNYRPCSTTTSAFVPRGVNWQSFESWCTDSNGSAYSHPKTSAADADLIKSWKINTVRLPLNQDCWLGHDGYPKSKTKSATDYRNEVKAWVGVLNARGIAVILDLHWSGPDGVWADVDASGIGQRAMADARSVEFWTSVATEYRSSGMVMFDAFNEPMRYDTTTASDAFNPWECRLTWAQWKNGGCTVKGTNANGGGYAFTTTGMQQLVSAIRNAGASQPILLAGRDWANDLGCFDRAAWKPVAPCNSPEWLANRPISPLSGQIDTQLVASFHTYDNNACSSVTCWNAAPAKVAATVPVVTTEMGDEDCSTNGKFVTDYMAWADTKAVGYLLWSWRGGGCANAVDENNTTRAPHGTALKAHLAKFPA